MRRAWVVSVLAGCSFPHGVPPAGTPSDGPPPSDDAPAPVIDAPAIDAPVDAEALCHVGVASTQGTDRGRVGGDGGSTNFPPLACGSASDRLVGIALRMSDQNTLYGQRSAHGLRIACAAVTVSASGTGTTGTITTYDIVGTGGFSWAPSTWTQVTQCKPGWIVSGMTAHTTDDDDLFLDVSITCAQIGPTGTVLATETLYVAGSLNENNGITSASCNANEIVVRMPNRSGAGIDSVNLFCTTPTCS